MTAALQAAWPEVWDELQARYNAPGGVLESDDHTRGFAIVEGVPDEL